MDRRVPPLVLMLLLPPLAGCIGGDDAVKPQEEAKPNETLPDGALPDGRRAIAYEATNRTEGGAGGVDHRHDYWEGREQVTLVAGSVALSVLPLFPGGQGTTRSTGVVRIPAPGLVYEGAVAVEFTLGAPQVAEGVPHPSASPVKLSYRTSSDTAFREVGPVKPGETVRIEVQPRETDMPHSATSRWAFRLDSDRLDYVRYDVTVVAFRGADVLAWPGHPDMWADVTERLVLDGVGTTNAPNIASDVMYGSTEAFVHPTQIVPPGTGWIDVWVNITSVETTPGTEVAFFFLRHHNATVDDDYYGDYAYDVHDKRGAEGTYHFVLNVTEDGMDSPYADASRWGFLVDAFVGSTVSCHGCYDVKAEWTIQVIVHKFEPPAEPGEAS
ncbi:MAG TPA: hypothetical protein VHH36_03580 [Candidatus Thermoplasmatota archaeon]|nr:hypothetical protein [Candidatus Thermoplasmatota archaeon]